MPEILWTPQVNLIASRDQVLSLDSNSTLFLPPTRCHLIMSTYHYMSPNSEMEKYKIVASESIISIMEYLRCSFTFHIPDVRSGGRPGLNGTWNGVIGDLLIGAANISADLLQYNYNRYQVANYLNPTLVTSAISFLSRKTPERVSIWTFFMIFSSLVWILIGLTIITMNCIQFWWDKFHGLLINNLHITLKYIAAMLGQSKY